MPEVDGFVQHLWIKPESGGAMVPCGAIALKANYGIDGDINAHPISPRQVLVVRAEDLQAFAIPPGALKENIVIHGLDAAAFSSGALLKTSGGAAIRLTFYCEPCKQIAHLVPSLKAIAHKRGILGVVVTSGMLHINDTIELHPNTFPPLSEIPYERFLQFVEQIPSGKVVTYREAIAAIGVTQSYLRVLPTYLKRAIAAGYPAHRVLDSKGYLVPHVEDQSDKLEAEGVAVASCQTTGKKFVPTEAFLWSSPRPL